ncbi:MAG: P-loop NTPase [Saccharofermentanales bacterium]
MSNCESCESRSNCSSQPSECGSAGNERVHTPEKLPQHDLASVRHVIGICSGKGGVGKSMVTALTAVELARAGLTVGILDADLTGPSIPRLFGLRGQLSGSEHGIFPAQSHNGIQIISVNLMLENADAPVIWRGPVISGVVKQFWTDVIWDTLDVLLIDMPPGTGDVPLTVFQSIPLDGIIMVSTPQDLVSMIVRKARNMALMMGVKVLGFVENMSLMKCPCCGEEINVFGPGYTEAAAAEMNVPLFDRLPIQSQLAELADEGRIEEAPAGLLPNLITALKSIIAKP